MNTMQKQTKFNKWTYFDDQIMRIHVTETWKWVDETVYGCNKINKCDVNIYLFIQGDYR